MIYRHLNVKVMWKFKTSVYKNAAPKPSKKEVSCANFYV